MFFYFHLERLEQVILCIEWIRFQDRSHNGVLMSLFRIFVNQLEEDDEEMVSLDTYESVLVFCDPN